MKIRPGGADDVPAVLALLDGATEWLVAQGRTDQWGTQPHSTSPWRTAQISGYAAEGGLWIAEDDGRPVGALAIGDAKPPVPPAAEPEIFVRLLVTDRTLTGQGLGRVLLDHARQLARDAGISVVRLDCFAGNDGALIQYYESQGFTRDVPFSVQRENAPDWPGQVLVQRL
ncbi:GNAT family N-acetyltransferase [Kribbella antibiotica]|uniref:GNAT family N-acetyltransferase n=1 Tax=Kribbella antibiotica TaxID=190195 RepID=A0A4R4YQ14_9ACTN|nr:GNAT family N-acetyltransferase [Kribbella antibiotica]TDD46229.1 GNAT family N-acetyltransferase [Kribbella antibiotica]